MFLLTAILLLLIGVVCADDATVYADSDSVAIDTADDTTVPIEKVESSHVEQKEYNEIINDEKNLKTATNNIYVSSKGKGNGKTTSTPANITYALSIINNNDVINMISTGKEDKYTKDITINTDSVKSGTNTFTITGQNGKNIVITSTLNISDMKITIKNINFTGTSGVASIESYNTQLTVENCSFTHDEDRVLNFNDVSTIDEYRQAFYTIIGYADNCKGAIYNTGDNLIVNNSVFNDNYLKVPEISGISISNLNHVLTLYGAAIYNTGNNPKITNNEFNNNNAIESSLFYPNNYWWERNEVHGGAIYNTGNSSIIKNNIFTDNSASDYGGAIYNKGVKSTMTNNTFTYNQANYGGAIYNDGDDTTISYSSFTGNIAYSGGALDNQADNVKMIYSNYTSNEATYAAAIVSANCIKTNISYNNFKQNRANDKDCHEAIDVDTANVTIKNNKGETTSIFNATIRLYNLNGSVTYNNFTDKADTTITVSTVKGVIGENLTLTATVEDELGNSVDEGNVIFKLNGITIKDNGKLTGSTQPLKVKVVDGEAIATVIPDINMRNANQLTASYIGTSIYNPSVSDVAKTQISQRNASIVVSSNVKTIKQGQVLTLTAKIYDTTNGKKSTNLTKYADEFIYFKVNGITLKDSKGNMLKVKVVNGTATTKYTIPLGLSGVTDGKTMTPKNHTILAGFYNKNYQENIRNTSTFQVERSNITITIANATVNNKTHKLSLTATIKDYLGNVVAGPNKCVIKINGISLKNGTQPMYYYSTNGILKIKDITIPAYNNYKTIEIVTQDRLAYKSQRNTTTIIKITG
jgi:predicted outer membrane repeat protein